MAELMLALKGLMHLKLVCILHYWEPEAKCVIPGLSRLRQKWQQHMETNHRVCRTGGNKHAGWAWLLQADSYSVFLVRRLMWLQTYHCMSLSYCIFVCLYDRMHISEHWFKSSQPGLFMKSQDSLSGHCGYSQWIKLCKQLYLSCLYKKHCQL